MPTISVFPLWQSHLRGYIEKEYSAYENIFLFIQSMVILLLLEAFGSIKSTLKLKATHRRIFCFCTQLRSTVRLSSSLRIDTFSVYIIASYCPPPHPHVLERDCTPGRIGMDGSHAVKAWESTTLDCTTSAFAASRLSLTRSAPQIDARFARKRNKTQKTVLQKKYL